MRVNIQGYFPHPRFYTPLAILSDLVQNMRFPREQGTIDQ